MMRSKPPLQFQILSAQTRAQMIKVIAITNSRLVFGGDQSLFGRADLFFRAVMFLKVANLSLGLRNRREPLCTLARSLLKSHRQNGNHQRQHHPNGDAVTANAP